MAGPERKAPRSGLESLADSRTAEGPEGVCDVSFRPTDALCQTSRVTCRSPGSDNGTYVNRRRPDCAPDSGRPLVNRLGRLSGLRP